MIRALIRYLFAPPVEVLPPPDRSVKREIEIAHDMALLRSKREREG